jgi:hypothetical protein
MKLAINLERARRVFFIIIKPNFMFMYSKKDISTFTDPILVEYLVDRIYERGYRNIAVADARSSYGFFFKNREVKTVAKYIGLSEKNYRIIDLSEDLVEELELQDYLSLRSRKSVINDTFSFKNQIT